MSGGRTSHPRSDGSAARPSTARPRTPATGSSPRTTPRSRPTSRPRSRRRPRTARRTIARPPRTPTTARPSSSSTSAASSPSSSRGASASSTSTRELLPHDTPYRRARAARRPRDHPVGQPELGLRRRAPRDPIRPSGPAGSRSSGICYGAQLMAHELGGDVIPFDHREYGPASVTHHRRRRRCSPGIEREQPVWMSHGDSITRLPEGFQRHGPDRLDAVRRARRRLAQPVRHPVPPRGRPHAARQGRPAQLRGRHRRRLADLDRRQLHRHDRRRHPRTRRRARPRRPGRTGWSSARCRAASTRRSRRRSSIARSATG